MSLKAHFHLSVAFVTNLEIWYKTPVSDFWTQVQTPSPWLSSVDNLRGSHLSSPSFHFLKLSQRDTPPLCWVTKRDNLCRRWPINLVPRLSLQYMEAGGLFLVKKWYSTPAVPHLRSWPLDMSLWVEDVLTRNGKLKEEYKEMSKLRRPLCLCTPPGVLVLLTSLPLQLCEARIPHLLYEEAKA